ncbi:hypothetical protein JL722_7629 [Aureococcus anophagefferens]|nr:hypothetical protein JL722_7629 [Aureococcus anophagefferens]
MALPRVSIPFNLGPEGFKYHVADGSQTLVTLSGILTHMQRHDEELKAQRERADKAEATVKKLGDELRQLGVKQALLLERADRASSSRRTRRPCGTRTRTAAPRCASTP